MEYLVITAVAVFLITRMYYVRKIEVMSKKMEVMKGQTLSDGERSQLKQVLEIMTWDGAKHEN